MATSASSSPTKGGFLSSQRSNGSSVSPVKGGSGSRSGTPASVRGSTPSVPLNLSSAPGAVADLPLGDASSSAAPPIRKIPPGCPHLSSILDLGSSSTSDEKKTSTPKIKSENDDEGDSEHLKGYDLSDKARKYLKRYVAGIRWGGQIRAGEVKMMDEEEKEAEEKKFKESIRKAEKEGRRIRKRQRLDYPQCHTCEADILRPFICLECAYTACFMPAEDENRISRSHMAQHLRESRHDFAFDIVHGTLYCYGCKDVVFDPVLETVLQQETGRVSSASQGRAFGPYSSSLTSLPPYQTLSATVPCRIPRGLRNMGATCFMNVIIQAFLHNPLLRNYFLSDRHNPALCGGAKTCLACEMDKIFTEFYSNGNMRGPHGPTSFLYCMWMDQSSSELSQAGQHDAHELFISALNGIHGALTSRSLERSMLPSFPFEDENTLNLLFDHYDGGSGSGTNSEEGTPLAGGAGGAGGVASCPCVVHRTFAGQLQSDVTCQRCGKTNTTKDPMLDLSLDVRPEAIRRRESVAHGTLDADAKKNKNKNKKEDKFKGLAEREGTEEEQHLTICLQRYCSEEKLGNDDYSCASCGGSSTATKQLSLFRLPPVLCIQLKRFEHTSSAAKIDTKVRFPMVLDVREFTTPEIRGNGTAANPDPEAYLYDLFTVVIHEGSMNTGHYTNFSVWRGSWYRFDDDKVVPTTASEVLSARAYQLCYRRRLLKNVNGIRPSSHSVNGLSN